MGVSHLRAGLIAFSLLLAGNAAPQPGQPASSEGRASTSSTDLKVNWQEATREDVIAAYEIFRSHHPGMFDPRNPGFPAQLAKARDEALAFGSKVHDEEGHARALALFSSVLADAHARVQAGYSGHGDVLWPGFRTVWRGDALHVIAPSQMGPPPGSILLGCDGKDAKSEIRDIFWWSYGRPQEAGQWWELAPLFFERVRSPYEKLPDQCRFRSPSGQVSTYPLKWRPVPNDLFQSWFEKESRRGPVGLTEPRPGMYLITLSTFVPDEKGRAQYAELFKELGQKHASLAAGRAIVIDLRHNHGGSSSWGDSVANGLWGEPAVEARLADYFQKTQIWWLADAKNAAHLRDAAADLRAQGRPPTDDGIDLAELASRLELAMKKGEHFFIEDYGASLAKERSNVAPLSLPPVYVITDGGCVSACLDALDVFTRFSGVKLVGAPTSADSNYIDIRFEELPSKRGVVILPRKIWVMRPRAAGEVYRPDIEVDDLDWSTATMLDHIERDLAHR